MRSTSLFLLFAPLLVLAAPAPAPSEYELTMDRYIFEKLVAEMNQNQDSAHVEKRAPEPAPSEYELTLDRYLFEKLVEEMQG